MLSEDDPDTMTSTKIYPTPRQPPRHHDLAARSGDLPVLIKPRHQNSQVFFCPVRGHDGPWVLYNPQKKQRLPN